MIEVIDLGIMPHVLCCEEVALIETLAAELHRQYRAAEKALNRASLNRLLHDHGWSACSQRKYFHRRAQLIIRRASCVNPQTLGAAEEALSAAVLMRRLIVSDSQKKAGN